METNLVVTRQFVLKTYDFEIHRTSIKQSMFIIKLFFFFEYIILHLQRSLTIQRIMFILKSTLTWLYACDTHSITRIILF